MLFNSCSYSGRKNTFTCLLSRYVKNGYVLKIGKRPSTYKLTELGREVCVDNPFGHLIERTAWGRKVDEKKDALIDSLILENSRLHRDNEEGREEGNDSSKSSGGRVKGNSVSSRSGGWEKGNINSRHSDGREDGDDEETALKVLREELGIPEGETIRSSITRLGALLTQSKGAISSLQETVKTLNSDKRVLENEVATLRSMLSVKPRSVDAKPPSKLQITRKQIVKFVQKEFGGRLNSQHFDDWGLYPYRVKGKNVLKKGDIEILSPRDREVTRAGHAKPLTPKAVWDCGFYIEKVTETCIVVNGHGLAEPKKLNY